MNARIAALIAQLKRKHADDSNACSVCFVAGHNMKSCMFLSPHEWSLSRQAMHEADENPWERETVAASRYGIGSSSIQGTRRRVALARVSTLRAMTDLLVQGVAAVKQLEAGGWRTADRGES